MTFREKLADLISGGALSVSRAETDDWMFDALDFSHQLQDAHSRLQAIAACETPGANATVKRMAKMAREALP